MLFQRSWVLSKPHDGRYGQSKPTAHKRYENNTCLRRKGALQVIGRSNPVETCMCLAVMKSILLRANRFTHLARSDHNFSVNVYGYIQLFWMDTGQKRTHCGIKACNINCLHINSSHFISSLDTSCRSSLMLHC